MFLSKLYTESVRFFFQQSSRVVMMSFLAASVLAGCQTTTAVKNPDGQVASVQDPGSRGLVAGVGIESNDIVAMTDEMVRDITATTDLALQAVPPRVIVDSQYFSNDSSQRLNKNQIVDRLRVGLQRAARGSIAFVNRERAAMIEQERALKRAGNVYQGTTGLTRAQAGADYRLTGRITSLDAVDQTGATQRYTQILFELTDMENGIVAWSNIYELSKAGQNDVVYR